MNFVKLNTDNAPKFVGYNIVFKTGGQFIVKKIISASRTSVKIDYHRLKNSLEILKKFILIWLRIYSYVNIGILIKTLTK